MHCGAPKSDAIHNVALVHHKSDYVRETMAPDGSWSSGPIPEIAAKDLCHCPDALASKVCEHIGAARAATDDHTYVGDRDGCAVVPVGKLQRCGLPESAHRSGPTRADG
jgi:hypothetical protein